MSNEQSPITNFEKFILVLSLNNNLYLKEMRIWFCQAMSNLFENRLMKQILVITQ